MAYLNQLQDMDGLNVEFRISENAFRVFFHSSQIYWYYLER